jgi:ketosteroid isomerase-like protein
MTDNVAIVKELYDAFSRGDIETVMSELSPDIDWRSVGDSADWPGFGERRGKDEVRSYFQVQAEELDFNGFQVHDINGAGDKVVAEGVSKVAFKRGGLPVDAEWAHIFTLKDGKITRFREYMDTAMVARRRAQSHAL